MLARGLTASTVPGDPGPPGDGTVARRLLLQWDGDSRRQSPAHGAPGTPDVGLQLQLWGWSFKVQPCCQWGSKGHEGPRNCLASCARAMLAAGRAMTATMELCQRWRHVLGAGCGAVPAPCGWRAWRGAGLARGWPPPALSHVVLQPSGHSPTRPCLRSRRRRWQREVLGSCLPSAWRGRDEKAARPLQPSLAVLSHLQSIQSPLKPGQAPASPWEKPKRSPRPAGRGKETWPRAIGCRSLCSCAWGCVGVGAGGLGQCQLCPQS